MSSLTQREILTALNVHGTHPYHRHPEATAIDWRAPMRRANRERVEANTCECRRVMFERVSIGGAYFVRRTVRKLGQDDTVTVLEVEETATLRRREVDELWAEILAGLAV